MDPATAWAIASIIITVTSATYSIIQAKKAASQAKKAADAKRGFIIPTEGEAVYAPIAYGRNLIGGSRVFHQTKSSFIYVDSNADKEFHTGVQSDQVRALSFEVRVTPLDFGYNDPAAAVVDAVDGNPIPPGNPEGLPDYVRWADTVMQYNEY
jgi:hypothetical protein